MYEVGKTFGSEGTGLGQFGLGKVGWVALHGEGAEQRLAAADHEAGLVHVFRVKSGTYDSTISIAGQGEAELHAYCAVFNASGELFISDGEK